MANTAILTAVAILQGPSTGIIAVVWFWTLGPRFDLGIFPHRLSGPVKVEELDCVQVK